MSGEVKAGADTSRAPSSQRIQQVLVGGDAAQMIGGQITVTIGGTGVKVPMGTTVLEAAKRVGVRIPTLCHHPDLCVAGVCRVCVVEVEGQRALQAACAFPITGSLKVMTHTRKVRQARRHIIELLLSTHYGECYSCKRNNNCELQTLAKEYGVDFYRFGHVTESQVPKDESSFKWANDILLDGRKIGGVLTAIQTQGDSVRSVLVGIGLNVATTPPVPPTPFVPSVGSLAEAGSRVTWADACTGVLAALGRWMTRLADAGPAALLDAYREASLVVGREVCVFEESADGRTAPGSRPSPLHRGIVRGIGADLALTVEGVETPVARGRLAFAEDCPRFGL